MTTSRFLWLHEETWEDRQKLAFAQMRPALAAGLYQPPAFVRERRPLGSPSSRPGPRSSAPGGGTAPAVLGRWIFAVAPLGVERAEAPSSIARAALEVQITQGNFRQLLALLSPLDAATTAPADPFAAWDAPAARAALSLMLSALLLIGEADRLRLAPLPGWRNGELSALNFGGRLLELWTPLGADTRLSGEHDRLRLPALELTPADWWAQTFAAADRKTLAYLEKRLATQEKTSTGSAETCPPRRQGRRWWQLLRRW